MANKFTVLTLLGGLVSISFHFNSAHGETKTRTIGSQNKLGCINGLTAFGMDNPSGGIRILAKNGLSLRKKDQLEFYLQIYLRGILQLPTVLVQNDGEYFSGLIEHEQMSRSIENFNIYKEIVMIRTGGEVFSIPLAEILAFGVSK